MPTENEARQLLAKAAATIDVADDAPLTLTGLPDPRPRRWPVLAAAAAVVLAIGGGFLVAQQLGDDPGQPPAPATSPTDRRVDAASEFVAWARGEGEAPAFADRVRLLDDGGAPFGTSTWIEEPTERWFWSMCSGVTPGDCGIDPTYVIEHHEGKVVPARGRALCVEGTGDLPSYLADAAEEDLVRLAEPEPASCREDLPVELWINADGEIYAVNLAAVDPDRRIRAARAFVRWARGTGPAPAFAAPLRVLSHGSPFASFAAPAHRRSWRLQCPRFMSHPCPQSAVDALTTYAGEIAVSMERAHGCGARPGLSPSDLKAAASDLLRIHAPRAETCAERWSVELWIDAAGEIYAVNATVPIF